MTDTKPGTGTVTRYWKTGLIITQADITGLITSDPADTGCGDGQRCQGIDAGSAPGLALGAIREQFLASMNALADAEGGPEVRDCEVSRSGGTATTSPRSRRSPATPAGPSWPPATRPSTPNPAASPSPTPARAARARPCRACHGDASSS
jgi:hypothetical protein